MGHAITGHLLIGLMFLTALLLTILIGCQLNLPNTLQGLLLLLSLIAVLYAFTAIHSFKVSKLDIPWYRRVLNALALVLISGLLLIAGFKQHQALLGYSIYFIPSHSMQPALEPGDVILVESKRLDTKNWQIGDIVVFADKEKSDLFFTKRIATKPDHLKHSSEALFFVLGDNVSQSSDSRTMGMIHRGQFRGKVEMVLWNTEQKARRLLDITQSNQS